MSFKKIFKKINLLYAFLFACFTVIIATAIYNWYCWIDDSYIGLRYAQMLAGGEGMVYNIGERVEGYTNFLWVLILAIIQKISGIKTDITIPVKILGTLFHLSLPVAFFILAKKKKDEQGSLDFTVIAASMFFVSIYTPFSFSATNGMETLAAVSFTTFGFCIWIREGKPNHPSIFFFLLATLTRFDAALIFGLACVAGSIQLLSLKEHWRKILKLYAPVVLIFSLYQYWRIYYFGEILPNTYYAKVYGRGVAELATPVSSAYLWWLIGWWWSIPLLTLQCIHDVFKKRTLMVMLFCICALFQFYVMNLPHDWIVNGRFQMPIIPIALFLLARSLCGIPIWISLKVFKRKTYVLEIILILFVAVFLFEGLPRKDVREGYKLYREVSREAEFSIRRDSITMNMIINEDDLLCSDMAGAPAYFGDAEVLDAWGLTNKTIGRKGVFLQSHINLETWWWGRIHPVYVAKREPDFFMMLGLGMEKPMHWDGVKYMIFCSEYYVKLDFYKNYRAGCIVDQQEPKRYVYFMQHNDIADRKIPEEFQENYYIEYENSEKKIIPQPEHE